MLFLFKELKSPIYYLLSIYYVFYLFCIFQYFCFNVWIVLEFAAVFIVICSLKGETTLLWLLCHHHVRGLNWSYRDNNIFYCKYFWAFTPTPDSYFDWFDWFLPLYFLSLSPVYSNEARPPTVGFLSVSPPVSHHEHHRSLARGPRAAVPDGHLRHPCHPDPWPRLLHLDRCCHRRPSQPGGGASVSGRRTVTRPGPQPDQPPWGRTLPGPRPLQEVADYLFDFTPRSFSSIFVCVDFHYRSSERCSCRSHVQRCVASGQRNLRRSTPEPTGRSSSTCQRSRSGWERPATESRSSHTLWDKTASTDTWTSTWCSSR